MFISYKLQLSMFLLFVNRNKKAMKTCGNCVDKEMNFAVKPLLFSMKGRKICRIIIMDEGNTGKFKCKLWFILCSPHRWKCLLSSCFYSIFWTIFPWHFSCHLDWVQAKLAHLVRSIFLSSPWAFFKTYQYFWFTFYL